MYGTVPTNILGFLSSAARLAATTALAFGQIVSVDAYEIDCNDILQAYPTAGNFTVFLSLVLNNTDVAAHGVNWFTNLIVEAALFDSYRFSKWE